MRLACQPTLSDPSPRGSCSSVRSRFSQSTSLSSSPGCSAFTCLGSAEVGVGGSSTGMGVVLAASSRATGPNDSVLLLMDSDSWVARTGVGGMSRVRQSGCVCSELDWISERETVTMESWLGACGTTGDAGSKLSILQQVNQDYPLRYDQVVTEDQAIRLWKAGDGELCNYSRPASSLSGKRDQHWRRGDEGNPGTKRTWR